MLIPETLTPPSCLRAAVEKPPLLQPELHLCPHQLGPRPHQGLHCITQPQSLISPGASPGPTADLGLPHLLQLKNREDDTYVSGLL